MPIREKFMIILSGAILISLMTACQKPTETVLPTNTSTPLLLPSSTKTPTAVPATRTPTTTSIDLGGLVTGTPVSEWKDIPVMLDAIAGSETSNGYLYTTASAPSEVAIFYTQEMPKLGWVPKPGNGTPQPGGVLTLVFLKGQEVCLVAIIQQGGGALVVLSRQAQ